MLDKIKINQIIYKMRHQYLTVHNLIMLAAVVVAIFWVWGSLDVMQRNYRLQKFLDDKSKELILAQLAVDKAELEQKFFKTVEYQELAVRQRLNLAYPGESVLILPANSEAVIKADKTKVIKEQDTPPSNFKHWLNFLSGANVRDLSTYQLVK